MDKIKLGEAERCSNGEALICRETGDHVHFLQRRRARSPRPHHAPSSPLLSPASFRYSECRKNQAAGIGALAYDGCGEYVSAADDPMKCSACGCHRSFHRRDPASATGSTSVSAAAAEILKALELQIYKSPSRCEGGGKAKEPSGDQDQERPICGGGEGGKESRESLDGGGGGKESPEKWDGKAKEKRKRGGETADKAKGKRLKTKFTDKQTERMREYAAKLRWKMSNESAGGVEIEKFCAEIGVQRERFRIWINNHKNNK